jgi:hypothetical protein
VPISAHRKKQGSLALQASDPRNQSWLPGTAQESRAKLNVGRLSSSLACKGRQTAAPLIRVPNVLPCC